MPAAALPRAPVGPGPCAAADDPSLPRGCSGGERIPRPGPGVSAAPTEGAEHPLAMAGGLPAERPPGPDVPEAGERAAADETDDMERTLIGEAS